MSVVPIKSHSISGIQILPLNNIWNRPVLDLPVHASSPSWIAAIGGTTPLQLKTQIPPAEGGIPFNLVTNSTPTYTPTLTYAAESYQGVFPIPASPLYEEPTNNGSDHHLVCFNTDTKMVYELIGYNGGAPGVVTGTSAWNWDITSNALPPDYILGEAPTTATASGMSMFAGLVFYDEIAAGIITHALYVALPLGAGYGNEIWPAKHNDGSTTGYPPQGARFRLKANVDISVYSAVNQIVLTALKTYGGFNCDSGTGSQMRLQGVPDARWNMTDLSGLSNIVANNFEIVDETSVMVSSSSGQAAGIKAFTLGLL